MPRLINTSKLSVVSPPSFCHPCVVSPGVRAVGWIPIPPQGWSHQDAAQEWKWELKIMKIFRRAQAWNGSSPQRWIPAPTLGLDPTSTLRAGSHPQPQDAKFPPGCSRDQDGIWSREPMVIPSRWNSCEKAGYELGSRPWEKPKALRAACSCWPVPALPARTSQGGLDPHQPFPGSPSLSLRYLSPKIWAKTNQIPGKQETLAAGSPPGHGFKKEQI